MAFIKCNNCGNLVSDKARVCQNCGANIVITPNTIKYVAEKPKAKSKKKIISLIILIAALSTALVIGLILLPIIKYNTSVTKSHEDVNNTPAVCIVDDSAAACADTLSRALNDYNYVSDGARIVYALRASGSQPGVNDVIIGITQLTSKADDSFYKIYKLVKTNGKWTIDPEHIKKVSTAGYDVTFDQDKLKASCDIIPQMVEISGKKYFFYAFLQNPTGDLSRAQVVMNMYDVESRAITTATYAGAFKNVNGEKVIVCTPDDDTDERIKWMNETARNFIRIIYFKDTEEQTVNEVQNKDEAIFKTEDVTKKVQAGNYVVYLLKDGSVIYYNKATGQNTKIQSGGAKDIGFYDTSAGIVSIRNSDDTSKRVNLNTGKIVDN